MPITSQQYRTTLQNIQSRYVKLELLNYQYQTVDELSGVCVSGSISIDANADIRRTGSITLAINNSTFEVGSGNRIWLDKYIRVYVSIMSLQTGEIEYTNCGMFIIDAPSYSYDPSTNTLNLSLLDLMAKLTGARNGYLPGTPVVLKAGENIRQTIIDTLALGGFTKYVVDEAPSPGTIPVDLDFSQGATVYDLLSGLRDIYPDYEIFFSVDGTFYYKPIPTGVGEAIVADDELWDKIVLSEQLDTDFQNVKNSIEVYGRTHDPAYFATATSVSGVNITITIVSQTAYVKDAVYGFSITGNTGLTAPNLQVGELASYPIKNDDGTPTTIKAEAGKVFYCVQFKETYWRWLGHFQAYGFAEDTNTQSPFYVEGTVGRIRLPLYGGEYDNCLTDDLAQQRAEYELWMKTNMNNTVTLSTIVVPWLDVNTLIQYTLKRNNTTAQYIIKTLNFGLAPSATGTVNMIQFYPNSPNITSTTN